MAKHGKKYLEAAKLIDSEATYEPAEAVELVKKAATAKFDETVEIAVRLGVDPRKQDQAVRGVVVLPHGTGKTQRVLVFAKGDKAKEAEAAGADFVGDVDMINKIQQGWFEFDVCVATPDMMSEVGKLGRLLGGKGLCLTLKQVRLHSMFPKLCKKSKLVKSSTVLTKQVKFTHQSVKHLLKLIN